MPIGSVVTRGYGPGATIPLVVARGYATGEEEGLPPPPPTRPVLPTADDIANALAGRGKQIVP